MQTAQAYLEIVRSRGERRLELERVYRNIRNRELFLMAYGKLYANAGATTPGTDPNDKVDAMSLKRIDAIIKALEAGEYRWKPTRRVEIPKKNGKMRPLGIPSWSDKLLQEVLRMVLSAYYEPQFSDCSHGFRPGRGCHSAITAIYRGWKGVKWFIEGDIRGCFDNIDHDILLKVIGRSIKDERLLKLLRGMLEAGYLEDWRYERTYSGTPQGGVISPLLANIFLNELDVFIETILLPKFNRGKRRSPSPEYQKLNSAMIRASAHGRVDAFKALRAERNKLPYGDPNDEEFRRLKYVRYADDFLLGFAGPKAEAETIRDEIQQFLSSIGLELSVEKTLISHATTDKARFLGYEIHVARANSRMDKSGRRSINGQPILNVPIDVVDRWKAKYWRYGKPYHRTELLHRSDYDIVREYDWEFQGLANYYALAHNVYKLYVVKSVFLQSLVKTLAVKHKRKVPWVMQRYYRKFNTGVTGIMVTVERADRSPLIAKFGSKPIRFCKNAVFSDMVTTALVGRSELVERLLADRCELCGGTENIEVHHIKKLANLVKRYQGRRQPPEWAVRMIEQRRKTLVVCLKCHTEIHAGRYDSERLK